MPSKKLVEKIYILATFVVAIPTLLVIFVMIPYYNKISTVNKNSYDKRVQLAIFEQRRNNSELTRLDYNKIKDDTANVSKIFINKDKMLAFISALENIATTRQVTQKININSNQQIEKSGTIDFSIEASGSWDNLQYYLTDLEIMDYYLNIAVFNATVDGEAISLILNAKVYSQ
jgi:hypothetical protein